MATPEADKRSVLFICLGNICRSPIAEAVFLRMIKERGIADKWFVDSAATADYHIGKPPEPRTITTLKKNGLGDYKHRVRQLTTEDFNKFDIIFGMDESNMSDLKHAKPKGKGTAELQMLGTWDPEEVNIIEDPYWSSGLEAFDVCFKHCERCLKAFLDAQS